MYCFNVYFPYRLASIRNTSRLLKHKHAAGVKISDLCTKEAVEEFPNCEQLGCVKGDNNGVFPTKTKVLVYHGKEFECSRL